MSLSAKLNGVTSVSVGSRSRTRRVDKLLLMFRYLPISSALFSLISLSLVSLTSLAQDQTTEGRKSAQLTYLISERDGACAQPVILKRGDRVTLNFPSPVRVSVPSRDQRVNLFISGRLVVVSAATSAGHAAKRSHKRTEGSAQVSVTTELKSGETFICDFVIPSSDDQRHRERSIKLIRVLSAETERLRERDAVRLIKQRMNVLRSSDDQTQHSSYQELDQALKTWRELAMAESLNQALGSNHFQVSDPRPLRAQEHLIYITLERVIVSETRIYLRALLRNHSQDTFELKKVFYTRADQAQSVVIWRRDQRSDALNIPTSLSVPADAESYPILLTAQREFLTSDELVFVGDRDRDITLKLEAFDELR